MTTTYLTPRPSASRNDKNLWTADECTQELGISPITFKRKVARGILPGPQSYLNPKGKYKKPLWRKSSIVNFSNVK